MPATSMPLHHYIDLAKRYIAAASELSGKPQKLTVVGQYLYWTQGKKQELLRVSTADITAKGERVIVTEEELAAAALARRASVRSGRASRLTSPHNAAAPLSSATTPDRAAATAATDTDTSHPIFSKEEEMLRERMRSNVTGISSFFVRPTDNAVFFITGLDLCVYYQEGPRAHKPPVKVFDYLTAEDKKHFEEKGGKPHLHVQFVTKADGALDFSRVSFVTNNNVYTAIIHEDVHNAAAPLSVHATPVTTIGDDLHQCGVADYIVQEEFDRYTGHYANDKYVIFSYTDMSMMRHITLLKGGEDVEDDDPTDDGTESMAYSRVGDPNALTTIVLYNLATQKLVYVPQAALVRAAKASSAAFSSVEYLPRFGFKDEEHIYVSLLSRTQEEMAVVSFAIADLPAIDELRLQRLYSPAGAESQNQVSDSSHAVAAPNATVESVQRIDWAWVDVMPGAPIFFGKTYDVMVRAAAETEKAHYHIYYRPAGHDADAWKPLTSGNWNVRAGSVRVLEERNTVAFIANVDGRLKYTLYSVTLPAAAFAEAVTAPVTTGQFLMRHSGPNEHAYSSFAFDENAVYFVTSNSHHPAEIVCDALDCRQEIRTIPTEPWLVPTEAAAAAPPRSSSLGASAISPKKTLTAAGEEKEGEEVDTHGARATVTPPPAADVFALSSDHRSFTLFGCPMVVPTLVTVTNRRGVALSAHLFQSPTAGAGGETKQPLALFVYGGPHVQLVSESNFDCNCHATVQALAHLGINVAIVDNQQATCNNLLELSVCKKNMGHFETHDYSDVVAFLTGVAPQSSENVLPENWSIDPARVGIFGWSYGGYATLLAMSQAADVFKMGFAGAPVGDWKLYDTGYTERYMHLLHEEDGEEMKGDVEEMTPKKISEQYMNSTIANFVDGFPDDLNRVFIAHGLLDENVHFLNTAHVVNAMIAAGKPYSMIVYPGERHGLRQKKPSRPHHEGVLMKTMVELL